MTESNSGNIFDHQITANIAKSTEEEDHLIRSTKKIKSSDTSEPRTMATEEIMASIAGAEEPRSQISPSQATLPAKSFKEALTTARNYDYTFDNRVEVLSSDEEDDDQEGLSSIEHSPNTRAYPRSLSLKSCSRRSDNHG
ncbi:hypothetical protein LOK49_LG13G00558 [Camellia lanceoleosa]|uniref:Uncharacterized protein n=1 Tax=Camellia lanceoleosa TaxID=1840588 RepID=A0ACC0FG76_9ERIC|nr:hypothetical protein LOK49_LG13G00558 [Camellia lanceoleosa]